MKTKEQLLAQREQYETQRQQITHQLQRLEQREKYIRQGAAKERTHKLCNIGGAVLHFWPEAQQLTKAEFYELLERLSTLPEVNEIFRQAIDLLPTVHEGVAVRQMEQRGIRTEKGDLNRWIKATNRMLQALKKKLASLKRWIDGIQIELEERDTSPNLVTLLSDYYAQRNQGTLSFSRYAGQKARVKNLKAFSETVNFLQANKLYTLEDLKQVIAEVHAKRQPLQDTVKANSKRIKELQELQRHAEAYAKTKPIYDQLQQIKFKKRREQFQQAHEPELRRFYLAKRKLTGYGEPFPIKAWQAECTGLQAESEAATTQANELWHEVKQLLAVQHLVNTILREKPEQEKEPPQRLHNNRR